MKKITTRIFIFITFLPFGLYQMAEAQAPHKVAASVVLSGIVTAIPGSRCGAGKVQLHASAHNPADTIKWYSRLTGGSSLGTGNSWTTPAISSSTTYYACVSKRGHTSARTAIKATINTLPSPIISPSGAASFCEGGSMELSISTKASAVEWSTGATTASIKVSAPGSYTVRISNASGCSAMSSAKAVTVTEIPHITSITPGQNCGHGQALLIAKANAGTVKWYTSNTATASISSGGMYFTPTFITPGTTTYYVDATDKGCTSTRIAVPATIKPAPSVTSTTPASRSGAGTVILKAASNKGVINWYAHAAGGVCLGTNSAFTTPSISATTVYYAEASLDGCSSEREAVTASVNSSSSLASAGISPNAVLAQKPVVTISPNPSKGAFKMTASADMIYIVDNESRKTIAEGNLNNSNNHTLEVKDFANGNYHFIGYNKSALVKEKITVSK